MYDAHAPRRQFSGPGSHRATTLDESGLTRRGFLRAGAHLAAGASLPLIASCAAPPPEQDPIDPSSLVFPPPPEQPRFYYERTIRGSADVELETSTDRWRKFATGESARGQGFAKPFGVAIESGRLFVSDTVSRRVHALDHAQHRYFVVGHKGLGRLVKPLGVAIDHRGHLMVCDGTTKRIQVYDLEGNFVDAILGEDYLTRPTDVSVSPDGSRIYVTDTGGVRSTNHGVSIFDANGRHLRRLGPRGAGPGEFNLPLAGKVGPDGRLYVVDTGNFRIQVFSPDGDFLMQFGEAGRYPGQMGHPKGIAIDSEGKIFISDTNFGVFQIFNNEGRILMSAGRRDELGGPARFLLPAGIAVDVDGRIYVADQFFRKVEVFRPATTPEAHPIGQPLAA